MKWAYGLTTVPERRRGMLPRTLQSLKAGGFPHPHLFLDGVEDKDTRWDDLGLQRTKHFPKLNGYGNWILGLAELWVRNPSCDLYAMFQDDFVCYRNLKEYLEKSLDMPGNQWISQDAHKYWNLYTFPSNQGLAPKDYKGWYPSNQLGRGAVALVFTNKGVRTLLTHQHMVTRVMDSHRGWKKIDGGISETMRQEGWQEMVHTPSLTQHIGASSTLGNRPHKLAESFISEEFDALSLLTS